MNRLEFIKEAIAKGGGTEESLPSAFTRHRAFLKSQGATDSEARQIGIRTLEQVQAYIIINRELTNGQ